MAQHLIAYIPLGETPWGEDYLVRVEYTFLKGARPIMPGPRDDIGDPGYGPEVEVLGAQLCAYGEIRRDFRGNPLWTRNRFGHSRPMRADPVPLETPAWMKEKLIEYASGEGRDYLVEEASEEDPDDAYDRARDDALMGV